jgi:putative RNA 2'-phosphotransferase
LDLNILSRKVSHALRHEPWLYELELDEGGWVSIDALLSALRAEDAAWTNLTRLDLELMIKHADKRRHELSSDNIRASYGHSTPDRLLKKRARPPEFLYHGTSPEVADIVRREGLKPMSRQYVHLSVDLSTAEQVGRRKSKMPAILRVKAGDAYKRGVAFYCANSLVWLADIIPAEFVE